MIVGNMPPFNVGDKVTCNLPNEVMTWGDMVVRRVWHESDAGWCVLCGSKKYLTSIYFTAYELERIEE